MKVLITGGKGQLASEILDNLITGVNELGEIPNELKNSEITSVDVDELDITNLAQVKDFFENKRPQIVINCAAMTNVDGCESNLELAFKVNAIGARNLAIACNEFDAKLVHISTDYVFEGVGTVPYCEWDICNPQSIYGKSKFLGENYVKEMCKKYFVFRTSWLYGYYGNNFVKTIIKAANEKDSLKVVNDQRGNPTNAADLAFHILHACVTNEYGIYHCTGEGECSWYDFACKIVELAKIDCVVNPCTTDEFPRPAKRPAFSSLNNLMLKSTIGNQMRDWETALKEFINKKKEV
jgi:dTDP-4-dehydrorhamnose reductase